MHTSSAHLRWAALFSLFLAASAHGQTLIQVSERAGAGDPINIVGDGFDSTCTVLVTPVTSSGTLSTPLSATVLSRQSQLMQAEMPRNLPLTASLYQVQVKSSRGTSNALLINQPKPYYVDTTEIAAGGTFRILGKNLGAFSGATPKVRIVDTKKISLWASIVSSDSYSIKVRMPTNATVGMTYRVVVSNGLGGTRGEVDAPWTVKIRSGQVDPFGLGTPWGADFALIASRTINVKTDTRLAVRAKGDGVTDDTRAIRGAIDLAAALGGAVVYLPTGTYRADSDTQTSTGVALAVKPNVVLKGDGAGRTIMQFGYRWTSTTAPNAYYWMMLVDPGLNGVMDMTIQNLNANAKANASIRRGSLTNKTKRTFLKGLTIELGNGGAINLSNLDTAYIGKNTIRCTSLSNGPLFVANTRMTRIEENAFYYRVGRIQFQQSIYSSFERNAIRRDNTYSVPNSLESGGIETSYCQQVTVADNSIIAYGPLSTKTDDPGQDDNELIMSQKSTVPDTEYVGSVTSATSTSLVDASQFWTPNQQFIAANYGDYRRPVAMIIAGKGVGQWRYITGNTTNTLLVDRPWAVVPDATSKYALESFSNYQQLILRNVIQGGKIGISIGEGAVDTVVDGNQLTNTGQLQARGDSRAITNRPGSNRRHAPVWNVLFARNTVSNTNNFRPGFISLTAITVDGTGSGTLIMASEVRLNNVIGNTVRYVRDNLMGQYDGYWNQSILQQYRWTATFNDGNIGSLFVNNVGTNLPTLLNEVGVKASVNVTTAATQF